VLNDFSGFRLGLGLFLIKEIIEKHDGNLHLSNSENGSAIVTIKIPIID
jgi:nitrogen fixation/metabolism regulation signal transduction histidine kinase